MRENQKDSRVRPCQYCSRAACVGPPGRLEASELVFVLANISSALLTIAVTLLADNKQVRPHVSHVVTMLQVVMFKLIYSQSIKDKSLNRMNIPNFKLHYKKDGSP